MGLANVIALDTLRPGAVPTNADNLTPRTIRQWLKDLPAGHLGQSTRQLYGVLREIHGTPLSDTDRFQILQLLDTHIEDAIRALRHKLVHLAFPLPVRDQRIIELANDILGAAVAGYRHILEEGRNTHWLLQPLRREMWLISLHRLLHYYSGVLCNHRLLNQAAPRGLWQSIHQLYRGAASAKWHKVAIPAPSNDCTVTIDLAYKQILLNSLMSFHQLRQDQMDEVIPLLDYFARHLVLRAPDATEKAFRLCILREQDTGPLPVHVLSAMELASMLVLDTTRVHEEIHHLLATGQGRVCLGERSIGRDTLVSLQRLWGETEAPVYDLPASTSRVEVVLGLKNIFQQLLATLPPVLAPAAEGGCPVDEALRVSSPLAELCSQCDGRWGGPKLCDTTDILLDAANVEKRPWHPSETSDTRRPPLAAHMRNLAPNRHELKLPVLQTPGQLSNGGVVGIRDDASQGWDVGRVTTIQIANDRSWTLQFVPLVKEALAVTARIERKGLPTLSLYGLIGSGLEGELILLLPYRPIGEAATIIIEYQEFHTRLRVTGNWCITPAVMAFAVDEDDVTTCVATPAKELAQTDAPQPRPPVQHTQSPTETDRYASLWNTL